jgi:hypothetical protein
MSDCCPDLNQRILKMAEGDDEFRVELIAAIYSGLQELKSIYAEGLAEKNEVKIQQIRHKVKPTLAMFGFDELAKVIQEGKEILESEGFGTAFEDHFQIFLSAIALTLKEVSCLTGHIKTISA